MGNRKGASEVALSGKGRIVICEGISACQLRSSAAFGVWRWGACEIDHRASELIWGTLFRECPVMALAELLSSFTTSASKCRD